MTDFEPFRKIPRLRRGCVITEKIDGTNAQVYVPEDPEAPLLFGSRNRWITPQDDNFGFAAWATAHQEELRLLGPGRHFGEWWGQGIQRRYGLSEKRFSLFNTGRWGVERPSCCHVVPVLWAGAFTETAVDEALDVLRFTGSKAAPGFMNPEGIVVFHPASGSQFKVTLDGDGHKGTDNPNGEWDFKRPPPGGI